jgi:phosphoglycerate dehydrogenase-like enzyme
MAVIWIDRPFPELPEIVAARHRHELVGPDDGSLSDADAVIVGATRWDAAMMDRAPRVRILARTGIGVDAVDLDEAARRGIAVTNTPDGPTVSTAEHTMALLFGVAKTIPQHQERLRRQTGGYVPASAAMELDGLTIGLLAYGRIARRVAVMASAIGMSVIAHDPFLTAIEADDPAGTEWVSFDDLLGRSDVLSLHAPLTPDTAGLFGAETFASCKTGVLFINCARGGLVDHDALLDALRSGQVIGAGLDVTDPEPLPGDHPLLGADNVIVTPHVASSTVVGRGRMLTQALEQVLIGLDGTTPPNTVNGVDLAAAP